MTNDISTNMKITIPDLILDNTRVDCGTSSSSISISISISISSRNSSNSGSGSSSVSGTFY